MLYHEEGTESNPNLFKPAFDLARDLWDESFKTNPANQIYPMNETAQRKAFSQRLNSVFQLETSDMHKERHTRLCMM